MKKYLANPLILSWLFTGWNVFYIFVVQSAVGTLAISSANASIRTMMSMIFFIIGPGLTVGGSFLGFYLIAASIYLAVRKRWNVTRALTGVISGFLQISLNLILLLFQLSIIMAPA